MVNKLDFHTPVIHSHPISFLTCLEDKADLYLSITNKIAYTTDKLHKDHTVVEIKTTPWTLQTIFFTALKVMSYALLVLPAIALALKIYKKYTHEYYILPPQQAPFTPSHAVPPTTVSPDIIVIDDDLPVSTTSSGPSPLEPKEDLREKGSKLDHTTITTVISHYRNKYFEKTQLYYFVQQADIASFSKPFVIKTSRKTPAAVQVDDPKQGGLCLSIHTGNHFVSLFVSFKDKKMVYYDSFGHPISPTLKAFCDKVKDSLFKKETEVEFIDIKKKHQFDGVNCGRYTINFLKEMMHSSNVDATIAKLKTETISSEEIHQKGLEWANEL